MWFRDELSSLAEVSLYTGRRPGIRIPSVARLIFLFFKISKPALTPTKLPSQKVPGYLPPEVKWPGHTDDHSPQSRAMLRMSGAVPPLPHLSSSIVQVSSSFAVPMVTISKCSVMTSACSTYITWVRRNNAIKIPRATHKHFPFPRNACY